MYILIYKICSRKYVIFICILIFPTYYILQFGILYLSKITFFKKKVKKGAKSTLFSKSKQNNNFTFQKSYRHVYIFYKKNMILGNGAKWNLKKDYEYNIIKK